MAKQDDFVRITLRIPGDLYERVTAAAETKSINAEILERLTASFEGVNLSHEAVDRVAQRVVDMINGSLRGHAPR